VQEAGAMTIPKSVGGSIQGFAYDRSLELWLRVSDSRFVLSDFYSGLPSKATGDLSRIDESVRIGSVTSSIRPGHRGRLQNATGTSMFGATESDPTSYLMTRSHCEDRISCALALKSPEEFKHWLGLYVRTLAVSGSSDSMRILVDMLLPGKASARELECAWWLSSAPAVLGLDRKTLVRTTVLPEVRKNLALQRLATEISLLI
jgi:protein HIRA/HIR1